VQVKTTKNVKFYVAGSVALITVAVYLAALQNAFVEWDDGEYVFNNPHIRSLNAAFLRWAFFDFYASNWHPLTWISHALDYAIWGPNPLGHHLTSIILHAVNTFLVVLLTIRLQEVLQEATMRSGTSLFLNERAILITGGVTGLLFGLHPVHVESVAWVAERKDLLCALFFLLSIITYTKYACSINKEIVQSKTILQFSNKQYLLSLGFFILALMSKPMAVSLPAVMLVFDWYPLKRIRSLKTFRTAFVEKLPFIALSLISSLLTILAQKTKEAISSMEAVTLSTRVLVAAKSLVAYLGKMAVPLDLIPFYPYPKNISLVSLEYLLAIVLVVGIGISCAVTARKQKVWLSVYSFYVITLLPVLGIVQVGSQSMADRYTYLPSLGPFFIMALGTAWVLNRVNSLQRSRMIVTLVCIAALIFLFASLAYLTLKQIGIWKNGFYLWTYVIEKEPEKVSIAYTNLGSFFANREQLDKAIENFDKAIALNPTDYLAYSNRGAAFDKMGQLDKAIESYDRAVTLNPNDFTAYYNRGITYERMGQLKKAIEDFEQAIALNPNNYMAHNNMGILYSRTGMYDRSIESFNHSIDLNPDYAIAYNNRGLAYSFIGQYRMAIEDFNKAILLGYHHGSVYYNRGNMYLRTGYQGLAISDFQQGCALGNGEACNALQALQLTIKDQKK
jgi:tetratricopeptide (TPR) repeat protein